MKACLCWRGPVTSCTVPIISRGWPRRSARPGKSMRGLSALDEAIDSSRQSGVPYWDAELQRRKGELLLAADGVDRAAAEACFRRAIDIAQGQSAKSLELRAATSLARLLAKQGQRRQAHDLLAPDLWLVHRGLRDGRPEGRQGAA